ncbi:Hypothetical protein PP7435_CHR1-3391 [Komagataella phaffii CBS 7435]|uniref:Uncharacterized protein n=1 Tax=Komagataella phaffii (strain ATCC 76273 / CBS 7435 / CECT 11047 / NRRL Y-11430 / Wegner 21-1) TaxID=981350 RepID=A0A1G4KPM2_KOMPC|nr:Hypothetical protein BQ9382_C1-8271 [Komagataella phaffii CBS 7435]SCV11957.1 Hypothetical protein PP7435_CHR1-3391 [Komagataella phaffii CBS 7435]
MILQLAGVLLRDKLKKQMLVQLLFHGFLVHPGMLFLIWYNCLSFINMRSTKFKLPWCHQHLVYGFEFNPL